MANPGYGQINSKSGNLYPYARLADDQGQGLAIPRDYRSSYLSGLGYGKLLDWTYVPLEDYKHTSTENKIADMMLNTGLKYTLNKAFHLDLKYQYERQQSTANTLQDEDSYFARNLVNLYSQIAGPVASVTYKVPPGGVMDMSNTLLNSHSFRSQLNFDHTRGKHEVTALLGAETRHSGSSSNGRRTYGYNKLTLGSGNVDQTATYPSLVTGERTFIPGGDAFYGTTRRYISAFGNGAYTYNSKYTLNLSVRRDASNLFGVSTNERWTPLGSAGISWNLSEEPFYKSDFLPYLKLRGTYGFSGNSDPGMTGVTTIEYQNTSPYTLMPSARFDNYANPEVRWETVRMLNMGLDFYTRNRRLSGSLEYYTKNGKNLFARSPLDYTAGIGNSILRNVASMKGRGVDFDLTSLNTTGTLRWTTNWNLSYNKDRIEDYYPESLRGSTFLQTDAGISGVKGKPVYSVFSFPWAGLDPATGDPRGYLAGAVSKSYNELTGLNNLVSDLSYHGSALPVFFGSVGNTLSYKNFSLSARLSFKANYYFRAKSIEYGALFASWNGHSDYSARWQKPGDEAVNQIPSIVYPAVSNRDAFYKFSEELVERGDHVRLQYVNFSYTLGGSLLKRLLLKDMSVYVNLNNAGILWRANKKGIDPEYINSAFNLPPAKSVTAGLRANF
ncbi:MAG: TonB-dependent receptor [Daejeonella sp.]